MTKKIKYSKGEIGEVAFVEDFLPAPQDLVLKEQNIKVTISLTKDSVDFFKKQAAIYHVPYQKLIKNLLSTYTANHEGKTSSN